MLEILSNPSTFDPDDFSGDKYLGEVTAANLITGDALASLVGFTTGFSQNSDIGWLKFEIYGKTLFIAKRSLRYRISWNSLNAVNLIYGDKTILINDKTYKVRLMKGAEKDPTAWTRAQGQTDPPIVARSEWNRLFYPVHVDGPGTKRWASFTNTDMNIGTGNGRVTLCQEGIAELNGQNIGHGNSGITNLNYVLKSDGTASSTFNHYGWRPVLELV